MQQHRAQGRILVVGVLAVMLALGMLAGVSQADDAQPAQRITVWALHP